MRTPLSSLGLIEPPSPPIIAGTALNGDTGLETPLALREPPSTSRFHFAFGSTDYSRRDAIDFETLLEGSDRNWVTASRAATLNIANLQGGSYRLHVRSVDGGVPGEEAIVDFTIEPPWWRTRTAYLGFFSVFSLCLFGFHRLRLRSIQKRADDLALLVAKRTEELEKANAAKTDFVASISHEIRNPMNGIVGTALALADTQLDKDQVRLVLTLKNCADFLSSLVNDVLDFASIEAGSFPIDRVPLCPRDIIDRIAAILLPQSDANGMKFRTHIDPTLPNWIYGDPKRIQQILMNFSTNALKFGRQNVKLKADRDGSDIVFTVSDDGPGIPNDERHLLFRRFSRTKAAKRAAIPGTGLGLAVCRALAESLGGEVGLCDKTEGSTFVLFQDENRRGPKGDRP